MFSINLAIKIFFLLVSCIYLISTEKTKGIHKNFRLMDLMHEINKTLDDPTFDVTLTSLKNVYHAGNICPFQRSIVSKVIKAEQIEIILVGGSVTYGADLHDRLKQRWSFRFNEILNSGWYNGSISVNNMGVGACNIDTWISRVGELKNADLIIVDLSVNDQGFDLQALPLLYENFVRLVDNLPKHPAIMFHYAFRTAKYSKNDINGHCPNSLQHGTCCNGYLYCKKWWDMQDFVAITLKKYRIPFVSFRDLMWPDFNHPPEKLPEIWNGLSHPDYRAHRLFSKLISYGFLMQLKESIYNKTNCDANSNNNQNENNLRYTASTSTSISSIYSVCEKPLTTMKATDSANSVQSFVISPNYATDNYYAPNQGNWRFFNDSKQKFGWILETTKTEVKLFCTNGDNEEDKKKLDKNCDEAIENYKITFQINLNFENPVLQFYFLKSYGDNFGSIQLWIDKQNREKSSIVLNSYWDLPYSVMHVVTISKFELINISAVIKGENYVLNTLEGGIHDLHISINKNVFSNEKFKFKILGIVSC